MKAVLLTRPHNPQAALTFEELCKKGMTPDAVILEPKTTRTKFQRIKRYVKKNGVHGFLRKVYFVLSDKLETRRRADLAEEQGRPNVVDLAAGAGVPTHFVDNHNGTDCKVLLSNLAPDLILIVGTRILKPHVIDAAAAGCLNAHPGWLPQFRGLNANGWAFLENGKLGATVHFVNTGIDTGDIVLRRELRLSPGDTMERLERKGATLCAELMAEAVKAIVSGDYRRQKQEASEGKQYFAMTYHEEQELRAQLRRYARDRRP